MYIYIYSLCVSFFKDANGLMVMFWVVRIVCTHMVFLQLLQCIVDPDQGGTFDYHEQHKYI